MQNILYFCSRFRRKKLCYKEFTSKLDAPFLPPLPKTSNEL